MQAEGKLFEGACVGECSPNKRRHASQDFCAWDPPNDVKEKVLKAA